MGVAQSHEKVNMLLAALWLRALMRDFLANAVDDSRYFVVRVRGSTLV